MTYTLKNLIIASGNSGAPGQSFRNHVAGSPGTGTKMSDYKIISWSVQYTPDPDFPITTWNDGQVWSGAISFTENSQAANIRRLGNVVQITHNGTGGASASGTSDIVSAATGSTASITVVSRANPLATTSGNGSFDAGCLAGEGVCTALFTNVINGGAGSDHLDISVSLGYSPDLAPFNPGLSSQFTARMADRTAIDSDFEWQWSDDGSTPVQDGGDLNRDQDHVGQDILVYFRWRWAGTPTYSSWAAITADDPRSEA